MKNIYKNMLCVVAVIVFVTAVWVKGRGRDFFANSSVVDLGNHKVAYLIGSDEFERRYHCTDWIVLHDLDSDYKLYIPAENKVMEIATDNFTEFRMEIIEGGENRKLIIPVCFEPEEDFVEMFQAKEKIIPPENLTGTYQPETIWIETVEANREQYKVSLERTSPIYQLRNDYNHVDMADYRLTVRNGNGKTTQELILTNLFLLYENDYWMEDIDGDGYQDIILCTDFINGQHERYIQLDFLVWDEKNERFEEKPLPESYIESPRWNEETKALTFRMTGENEWVDDMKMYRFLDGEWKLYGKVFTENNEEPPLFEDWYQKEIYYKELAYQYRVQYYDTSGKVTEEMVLEDAPWMDEESIWHTENEKNKELLPRYTY